MAYGKRARIANAILELRRPLSFEFPAQQSNSNLPSPVYSHIQFHQALTDGGMAPPMMHSRMKSQGQQSHHSFPGSGPSILSKHKYSLSMQGSVGSSAGPQQQQEEVHETVTGPSQDMSELGQKNHITNITGHNGLGIDLAPNGVWLIPKQLNILADNSIGSSFLAFALTK
jgi:hypothetical protein